jgi:Uma2 family endonuclease
MVAVVDILDNRPLRPLRRSEFDRLVALGVFEGEKVELIRGVMVEMSPTGLEHVFVVTRLSKLLIQALADRGQVRTQQPFAASDESEPEPDVAIVPAGDYLDDHPTAAHLLIEVADSSLRSDRTDKLRLYAESGVPEYWIVNLIDGVIEIHREPTAAGYAVRAVHARGSRIAPLAFADVELAVDEILPPLRR